MMHNLTQLVNKTTHVKGGMLDLLIMDKSLLKSDTLVITDTTFRTDHHPIVMKLPSTCRIRNNSVIVRSVRELYKFDMSRFSKALKDEDIANPSFVLGLNISEAISLYNSTLARLLDDQCPIVTKRYRLKHWNSRWYNSSLKELKRKKRAAERKYRKNQCVRNRDNMKRCRNEYNFELKQARERFYHQKLTENITDSKQMFKVLKRLTGTRKAKTLPTSKNKDVAEEMASFYTKKISNIRDAIMTEQYHDDTEPVTLASPDANKFTMFQPIDRNELKQIMFSMKSKTSRADPVETSVVKQSFDILAPVLLHIINSCISQNCFPDSLKKALITPIIKDETKNCEEFQNYRPISNLEFLSKLLERVIYVQLTKYIEKYNLHARFQSAYKPNHSCETAMAYVINDIQKLLEEKHNVVLAMLDLSSAFDTVDHKLLIDRLERQFGISEGALQLIKSYLCDRSFSVVINEDTSKPHDLQYGVPQGSILGPLFYLLYTKEIETIVEGHGLKVHLYADDCTVYFPFNDDDEAAAEVKLTQCVNNIKMWMSRSFLKLNADKTSVMLFRSKESKKCAKLDSFCLTDGNNKIKAVNKVKLLGVSLEESLNFSDFANRKIQACNFHLRNLRAVKQSIPTSIRIRLVTSLICSTIDYCNALLICSPKYVTDRLQKTLNKAVRFIFDVRKRDHISPYLFRLHILPVIYRVKFKVCVIAYKVVRGTAPPYLREKMEMFKPTYNKILRPGSGRDKWMFQSDVGVHKSSTYVSKMKIEWNELPLEIRRVEDYETFKSKLKTHYFKKAFGSLCNSP